MLIIIVTLKTIILSTPNYILVQEFRYVSHFHNLFNYLYTLFNEGETHLANIYKLFYQVALSNKRNIYT